MILKIDKSIKFEIIKLKFDKNTFVTKLNKTDFPLDVMKLRSNFLSSNSFLKFIAIQKNIIFNYVLMFQKRFLFADTLYWLCQ